MESDLSRPHHIHLDKLNLVHVFLSDHNRNVWTVSSYSTIWGYNMYRSIRWLFFIFLTFNDYIAGNDDDSIMMCSQSDVHKWRILEFGHAIYHTFPTFFNSGYSMLWLGSSISRDSIDDSIDDTLYLPSSSAFGYQSNCRLIKTPIFVVSFIGPNSTSSWMIKTDTQHKLDHGNSSLAQISTAVVFRLVAAHSAIERLGFVW